MKSIKKIALSGLMASKEAKNIFKTLQIDKNMAEILFVGGCVRNILLKQEVADIDLATKWSPQEIMAKLKAARIKVIPTGLDHGTVTAVVNGVSFQITTLRQDIDTDGRHAKVEYTNDWLADARRRDFTINTLLADIKGNIFDPLGKGLADLEKRKIVFVGDPETRIREDYLRILRFFRFHAWYGKGKPDAKGLAACSHLASGLKSLSKERVTQEIFKIILSANAGSTFALMQSNNILKGFLNSKFKASHFNALKNIKKIDFLTLGLLVLGGFSKSGAVRIVSILRLTNKQQKQIDETLFYLKKFKTISEESFKLLLYRAGPEVAEMVLISRLLLDEKPVAKSLNLLRSMERPVLPLRGQDLLDQGMKPGPDIKKALDKFERSWIRRAFN